MATGRLLRVLPRAAGAGSAFLVRFPKLRPAIDLYAIGDFLTGVIVDVDLAAQAATETAAGVIDSVFFPILARETGLYPRYFESSPRSPEFFRWPDFDDFQRL